MPPRDNGHAAFKQRVRHEVLRLAGSPRLVLETFAGPGNLYQTCWRNLCGLTIDKDPAKVLRAAVDRPGWLCVHADSEIALRAGIGRRVAFDILDIDAWGQPWPFLRAWLASERVRAPRTWCVLTDGLMGVRFALPSKALFGSAARRRLDSSASYLEVAQARVTGWAAEAGLAVESFRSYAAQKTRRGGFAMHQHVVVFSANP